MDGSDDVEGTLCARRSADVLYAFIGGPASLGVSEVARQLGISKAVVHRIFQALASRGFLKHDPETRAYRLGPSAGALGARALRDMDMRRAARPVLEKLRDDTGETTTVSEIVGDSRVYLEQFESRQTIRMLVELGRPHALHAGGSGKAILAFLSEDRQAHIISKGLTRLTDVTITDSVELRNQLKTVEEQGFAVSLGERAPDAGSIAAPVFASDGNVIGSLSVCGPVGRFTDPVIAEHSKRVLQAGEEVSRRMGWDGPYPPRARVDGRNP
jgi:DNA-binding IclR family transcriptional regulator